MNLQPGDLLILYSDGLTEARNQREIEFGESRLEALVAACREAPLADIQQQVLKAVRHWAGEEVEDDMTLLVVRASGPGQEAV